MPLLPSQSCGPWPGSSVPVPELALALAGCSPAGSSPQDALHEPALEVCLANLNTLHGRGGLQPMPRLLHSKASPWVRLEAMVVSIVKLSTCLIALSLGLKLCSFLR